jgi:quinol monooxygenase YgiN
MIRLSGRLVCMTDAERAAVLSHRAAHQAATRAEPGCLSFTIDETDDPLIFDVSESFRDRAAFDAHQTRTRDSAWFAATRGILRDFRVEELRD